MTHRTSARALTAFMEAGLAGELNRRTLLQLAGTAAAATGLAMALPRGQRASAAQAADNVFIYGSGQDISNLDPHTGSDYSIIWGQRAVYDGLMRFEGDPIELKPLVLKEATGSEDASTWTLVIDERATFQDGSKITAEAVQWNFNRMLTKNKANAWMFAAVMNQDSITVVDEQTLEIALIKPFAPFDLILPWLFVANPAIVAEHAGDDDGESWLMENAAGSGPYTISRFEPGSLYQFDRFPGYWYTVEGAGDMVETFVWRIIRESSTKRIALESGEIQYGDTFSTEDIAALMADDRFMVNEKPSFSPFQLKLNTQVGPTADVNVRKALTALFDYDAALESLGGRGELLRGPLPTGLKPWFKEDLPGFKLDMDAAREHLAASQYPNGFDIEFVYVTGLTFEETFGLILLEKAAELGINVTLTPLVWPDMVARAADAQTMPGIMAVLASSNYVDPDNYLWAQYHSSQAGTWSAASWYQNPDLDALLEEGRSTVDPDARKAIYDEAQQILVDDAVDIWIYAEMPNEAWVKELGPRAYQVAGGGDIRQISYNHPA
ncbi:MAG TPA: ABC transporter substrate-binding protein [Thermomicrobiales bacterium]|nr:ABC transporter substrate-binding protein [Thermomicrobiales bacterium]